MEIAAFDLNKELATIRESFPRIADSIEYVWGTPDCFKYIQGLVIDSRGGRRGFPVEVINSLLRIYNNHSIGNKSK